MEKKIFKYDKAVKRLEEIIKEIESNESDIDTLADKLKEAKSLLKLCKEKLFAVDKSIKDVLQEKDKK